MEKTDIREGAVVKFGDHAYNAEYIIINVIEDRDIIEFIDRDKKNHSRPLIYDTNFELAIKEGILVKQAWEHQHKISKRYSI